MSRLAKRRDAMLLARGIAERVLTAVGTQGPGKPDYTLSHDEMERISAAALDVAEYLCVPRES
jgi:hypothetical protein